MTKIVAGAAPTSTLSSLTPVDSAEPWTPVCVTSALVEPILAADSWQDTLIFSTTDGGNGTLERDWCSAEGAILVRFSLIAFSTL